MQPVTLAHLIDREVDYRHSEWFAGCMANHASGFPAVRYELGRIALLGAASFAFLSLPIWLVLVGSGLVVTAAKALYLSRNDSDQDHLNRLGIAAFARAAWWSAATCGCVALAPPEWRAPLVMIAALAVAIDSMSLIALPLVALGTAAIQLVAIAGALAWLGGPADLIAAAAALLNLFFVHWGVFHLNHTLAMRHLRTRELKDRNETVQLLLNYYDEESSDWLFECDRTGRILNPSERFCEATRLSRRELGGMRFTQFMLDSPGRTSFRERVQAGEPFRDLVAPVSIANDVRWWSLSARPAFDAEGEHTGWRGFIADVTKTRQAEEKAAFMENYDVLTGLPNRHLFTETLVTSLQRRESADLVAVLQIDLSQFKTINDTHGHTAGDRVLAEIGKRIESAVPPHAMIGRLGGDEFAVIIENARNPEISLRTAKAVSAALNRPAEIDGQQMPLGACIGVAHGPCDGETAEEVMRAADLALHDAKSKGRHGASLFVPEMQAQAKDRRQLELDLRGALTRHELEVHYQPLLNAESGKTVGYEALLRWKHPARGMVPPTQFIPIAEESGQIIPIGAWVLREALMEASRWPQDIFISINLSPIQMRDPRLVSTIFMALSASGVAPHRVELEITESVLLSDSEENLALLHKIRDLGVKIVMDDFGTGYSSLSYLRSFPFDKIKIDRCFVTDLAEESDSQAIVSAVIKLAEELGMCTLAEGVENIEQLDRLRQTGCEQVQGFLFSRARPASELEHHNGGHRPIAGARPERASVTPFRVGEIAGHGDHPANSNRATG
jgi:diguanylate cyclase (GGDEF)-like protein/PAS domain S-box-containing protein